MEILLPVQNCLLILWQDVHCGNLGRGHGGSISAPVTTNPLALVLPFLALLTATYLLYHEAQQDLLPPGPEEFLSSETPFR